MFRFQKTTKRKVKSQAKLLIYNDLELKFTFNFNPVLGDFSVALKFFSNCLHLFEFGGQERVSLLIFCPNVCGFFVKFTRLFAGLKIANFFVSVGKRESRFNTFQIA